jgi:hypothetical protein
LLFPPRRRACRQAGIAEAISKIFATRIIHFSHPNVNVSLPSTCRDEIIQDFSGATIYK